MAPTTIVGIDLSGPANAADTALIIGHATAESLELYESRLGVSDTSILALARKLAAGPAVLALDAPLSYNEGGGDRPSDRHLRRKIIDAGMASGSVMSPTMTRMAYLTLRGIAVARGIQSVAGPTVRIVEVHPGATMALRGAPIEAVRGFAKQPEARTELLRWLGTQGIGGLDPTLAQTSHQIAAVAAALAGWSWEQGRSVWSWKAAPPLHPFDFAC
ncbi:MAG: DUF429 domain-containing protein [Myxococcales bacterium]|nr:DUF429 domain-containing protein [Myxococcales bacterium]